MPVMFPDVPSNSNFGDHLKRLRVRVVAMPGVAGALGQRGPHEPQPIERGAFRTFGARSRARCASMSPERLMLGLMHVALSFAI